MSDDAYIRPSHEGRIIGATAPVGTWQRVICDSHAVADSVMNDLAEALRQLIPPVPTPGVAGVRYPAAEDALARFDALNKDTA